MKRPGVTPIVTIATTENNPPDSIRHSEGEKIGRFTDNSNAPKLQWNRRAQLLQRNHCFRFTLFCYKGKTRHIRCTKPEGSLCHNQLAEPCSKEWAPEQLLLLSL